MFRKILTVVAVAGVVAAVSAQVISTTDDQLKGSQKGTITLSIDIDLTATMTVTDAALSTPATLLVTPTASMQGNAGVVHVVTNYTNWDIGIEFENGGFLVYEDPIDYSQNTLKTDDGTGTATDAQLDVIIVLRGVGNTGANRGSYAVPTTDMDAPISLAETFGATPPWTGAPANIDGRLVADIATDGFAATTTTGLHFGINAGLGAVIPATGQGNIIGNKNGTYTETITFTMYASY